MSEKLKRLLAVKRAQDTIYLASVLRSLEDLVSESERLVVRSDRLAGEIAMVRDEVVRVRDMVRVLRGGDSDKVHRVLVWELIDQHDRIMSHWKLHRVGIMASEIRMGESGSVVCYAAASRVGVYHCSRVLDHPGRHIALLGEPVEGPAAAVWSQS